MSDSRSTPGPHRLQRLGGLAGCVSLFTAGLLASIAVAQTGNSGTAKGTTVVACHLTGTTWTKLTVKKTALETLARGDVLASGGKCPRPRAVVVCHARKLQWVPLTVPMRDKISRLKKGDVLPVAGRCPASAKPKAKPKPTPRPVTTQTAPPPVTTAPAVTTTPAPAVVPPPPAPGGDGGSPAPATTTAETTTTTASTTTTTSTDTTSTDTTSTTTTPAPEPLAVVVGSPADWSFAVGTTTVVPDVSGGTGPYTAQLLVDGVAVGAPVTAAAPAIAWDTTRTPDGTHLVSAEVTDSAGGDVTSAAVDLTVDNTPPEATMYAPPQDDHDDGPTLFQVHASDAFGVASVRFTVDGSPVGDVLYVPDTPGTYLYSTTFDASTPTPGTHAVSAVVTDDAGNVSTAAPVTIVTGPTTYVPVVNWHGIEGPLDADPDTTDQTEAQAEQELAYLQSAGYQSINLEQYDTWLQTGQLPAGITKPILLTVDDGLTDEEAWDPLLRQYGFTAVLFVVTGFTDNLTPGTDDPTNKWDMSWNEIRSLAATGRWEIAFHAGEYGHGSYDPAGDSDPDDTTWTDPTTGDTYSYTSDCWTYYTCLPNVTSTNPDGTTTTVQETPQAFEMRIAAEVSAGMAELQQQVPTASMLAWACPWNACGQWTNQYNDTDLPGTPIENWLPGFYASVFPIVFTQTDPVTYAEASGAAGSLSGFNRRYRFEVDTDTTLAQFEAALTDPAFEQ